MKYSVEIGFNGIITQSLDNRNIYKILRETINEWLLKLETEVMIEDVENTNEEENK